MAVVPGMSGPGVRYEINNAPRQKLLRAAARAVDPWNQVPLVAPSAYANSTAYLAGEVFTANSNMYVVVIGGTTAASGTGPSANFGAVTDGTVTVSYLGSAWPAYTDSEAPAITVTTTSPVGTLPNVYSPEPTATSSYVAGVFKPLGGYVTFDGSNRSEIKTFDRRPTGDIIGRFTGWEFESDAPSIAIRFRTITNSRTVGIEVDGKLLKMGGVALISGGQCWIKLDFPAGTRKLRTFRVWHPNGGDNRFADVYITNRDLVQAPTYETVRAAFISDSIFAGSSWGPFLPGGSMPQRISSALGWDDPWNFTQGGTGYLNPATDGGGDYFTYRQRVAEAATRSPDAWVLFGSTNDGGYTSGQRQAESLATLQAIRALSSAPIFMMGVWSVNSGTPAIEADLLAAFTVFNDSNSTFIPVSTPTVGLPFITGAWNNSGHSAASNDGIAMSSDAIHPFDVGTQIGAIRAANEIRAAL